MKNHEIAEIFKRMGRLLDIKGENVFKIRAYFKAAEQIENLSEDIEIVKSEGRLADIPGIGKALQEKIILYCQSGHIPAYEKLIQEMPESLLDLYDIPSLGPKKIKLLYDELKVKSITDLEQALKTTQVRGIKGFQKKTIEKIIEGIHLFKQKSSYMDLASATQLAEKIIADLKKNKVFKKIVVAGSLRRGKEFIRDIDLLGAAVEPDEAMNRFVHLPYVKSIQAYGPTKSSILTNDSIQVDLRIIEQQSFGAAWIYFTGSKSFNILLRQWSHQKDQKVNEYGIFQMKGDQEKFLAGETEKSCFKTLGLPYIPPELREEIGFKEIGAFADKKTFNFLSKGKSALITEQDIMGDLHVHSTWSDGRDNIESFIQAAIRKGYKYLGISDHSEKLAIANGLTPRQVGLKKKEIGRLQARFPDIKILHATEVEIDSDGNLDYDEELLSSFDLVIAAIHTGHSQPEAQLTRRLIGAMENKWVDVIAHPTGHHLGKRASYAINLKSICEAAVRHQVWLEINAFPVRLDLNSQQVHAARSYGVKFIINTDAHTTQHLDYMKYGVSVARRAWLQPGDVVNTLPVEKFIHQLEIKKGRPLH